MTEEFKSTLFKYLIGKLPNEKGDNKQIIEQKKILDKEIYQKFLPENYDNINIENIVQMPQKINDISILYGGYLLNGKGYGMIMLLDGSFNPIKSFFEYDNGTKLRYIDCLYVDDNGEIYAVDDEYYTSGGSGQISSQKRFLYLNNFTQKNNNESAYVLNLNKSYNLIDNNIYCHDISKSQNSSYFSISGGRYDKDDGQQISSVVITLKVNVGQENEWNKFVTSNKYYRYGGIFTKWDDDDNFNFKMLLSTYENDVTSVYLADLVSENLNYTKIYDAQLINGIVLQNLISQVVFLSDDNVYFVLTNSPFKSDKCTSYIINYNKGTTNIVYQNEIDYLNSYQEQLHLFKDNNDLYVFKKIIESEQSTVVYISNSNFKFIRMFGINSNYNAFIIPFLSRKYNLLTYFITNDNFSVNFLAKEVNIVGGYNGEKYTNTNSLISNSSKIYNNDDLIFARNLYNKTINNGTTVSIIEIPNNYLNSIDLTSKNLLSETNLVLVKDENVLQKNEYETLYVNFINSIVIADKNTSIQVNNTEASSYLNSSINDESSYDKAKLYNSIIITYQDGSTKEIGYDFEDLTDYSANITFGIYTDKLISKAEIVSNDKTVIYQTIDLSLLELGKNYSIKQRLEVL